MESGRKQFEEEVFVEIISATGGIFAGSMLALSIGKIELLPGLLILLPGFLEMRGNISGSLSARLSAALFLKYTKPKIKNNFLLKENVISAVALALIVSFFLGAVAFLISYYIFGIYSLSIIYIAMIAGIISNLIEIPVTVLTTFWLFRHGHDPNNVMGPYLTALGDIVSVASILAVIALFPML
ncbi:MAG: magnesium transporter [Candidatus Aenigmarchaeota archaeon]|nr:magnesium transporter [Candidatus Aenigmarchaeota archaeon]